MNTRIRRNPTAVQALGCGLAALVAVLGLAVGGSANALAATTSASGALATETSPPPPVPAISPNETHGIPTACSDWYFQEGGEFLGHTGRWEFNCWWDWDNDWYYEQYFWHVETEQIRLSAFAAGSGWMTWYYCRLNDSGSTICDL